MNKKQMVEYLWYKFAKYKETAGQHEFIKLFALDNKLFPLYHDLQVNYSDEHADIFIRVMTRVLKELGADIPELIK